MSEHFEFKYFVVSVGILNWEWFKVPEMVQLMVYFLANAAWEDYMSEGYIVERGQIKTTVKKLSEDTGQSVKQIRTCISRMEKTGEIIKKSANKYSIITLCNYDKYADMLERLRQTKGKQRANKGQTKKESSPPDTPTKEIDKTNKRIDKESNLTVTKESTSLSLTTKKEQNKKALEERRKVFFDSLIPYVKLYGMEMIRKFYDHWSEANRSYSKMKFELEDTWELPKRLATWERNSHKYDKQQKQQPAASKEIVW